MPDVGPEFDEDFQHQFQELLIWRRDVRHFKTTPLPDGLLDEIITEACLAPSVGNCQPWRCVMVDKPERRKAVYENFRRANDAALSTYDGSQADHYAALKLAGLKEAPVHLAVFAEQDPKEGKRLGRVTMPETVDYSVVGSIQTLWLAARLRGVGVGWVSILDPDQVNGLLDVPDHWRFIGYLCIGFPAEDHKVPELVRSGWQDRIDVDQVVYKR
jgi:5,6-dimethylbenzimidazole synthase